MFELPEKMTIYDILKQAVSNKASDIFITVGSPVLFKCNGEITGVTQSKIAPDAAKKLIEDIFALTSGQSFDQYAQTGDCDFSFSLTGVGRFRISAFKQRNSMAAVIRVVNTTLADADTLGIPPAVTNLYKKTHGMILVTGPAGSGKSTTLACLVDMINQRRKGHILTLEDPVEYLHSHKNSIVNQREVGSDTASYARALRAGVRQAPDVLLIGEMRDFETVATALTAAETGHLVLSSLHTIGAVKSIDRIIDVFPPNQQQQVRIQLSTVLQAVVSQQLLPSPSKGRTPVFEIMILNAAIRNMIRESKNHQIDNAIHSGAAEGMQLMDHSIAAAYRAGNITKDDAFTYCVNPDMLSRYIR